MSDDLTTAIHHILHRTLASTWKTALHDFTQGAIGKLRLLQIITDDLHRMETELGAVMDLYLKQNYSAELAPVWADNLKTKALLLTLLDHVEQISAEGVEQSMTVDTPISSEVKSG